MTWTRDNLQAQLHAAKRSGIYQVLHDAAAKHSLGFGYVLAIASRETGLRHIRGDHGHGYGVMQLDDRSHHIPADWETNPERIVSLCCTELASHVAWAERHWPELTARQHLKVAAAAYNSGRKNTTASIAEGNCDLRTTGQDYGWDVLKRMEMFNDLLQG